MRRLLWLAACVVVLVACADGGAGEATVAPSSSTPTSVAPASSAPTSSAPSSTVADAELDIDASRVAAETFLTALFDQEVAAAEELAAPGLRISDFFTGNDRVERIAALAGDWGMETISTTCSTEWRGDTSVEFGCEMDLTDDFARVAPYEWSFLVEVTVVEGLVHRVHGFEFVDVEVTVDGVTKTVTDWANEWIVALSTGPDSTGCTPALDRYCSRAFIEHAERFWSEHPDIRAAAAAAG